MIKSFPRNASLLRMVLMAALLASSLSACTMFHPPDASNMPSRAGLTRGEAVVVQGNQNIYTLAREHNVSMREMIVINELKPPYEIRPGQKIYLPAGGTSFSGDMKAPVAAPLDAVEKTSLPPITPPAVSSQPLSALPAASSSPQALVAQPTGGQVEALNRPAPVQAPAATTASPSAAASSSVAMIWPVQGPIVSSFGSKGAGLNNDGINISAPKGAPVVSAAAGTVVYAGNEMKGFGNLVLIRHQGDWVTAYAHLDRVMVKKDSVLAQGDMIGTVGKTGNVTSPQLHFETRQNEKPVDPAQVIRKAQ